jgi:hypothetical protein
MTIGAAVLFTALYFTRFRTRAVFATMMMFWGAALMWSVDCVHSLMDGEGLFDLSREDAVLGTIILAAGFAVFAVLSVRDRMVLRRA